MNAREQENERVWSAKLFEDFFNHKMFRVLSHLIIESRTSKETVI